VGVDFEVALWWWAFGCYVVEVGHGGRFGGRMSGALGLFHIPHLWDMYRFRASTAFRKSTLHGLFTARVCEGLCFLLLGLHSVLRIFYHVYKRRNGLKGTSILHRIRGLCRNTCFWFTSLSRFLRLTGFSGMFPPCHNSVSESNFPVAYHLCPAEGFTGGHLEHYLRHHLSHFSITLPNHCESYLWFYLRRSFADV
jgi:hypothetical protein